VNPELLELALAKQRLQLQSASQRDALVAAAAQMAPLFAAADAVREGVSWLRRHPQWLAGAVVAIAVARPGRVLRWAGRVLVAVRAWRSLRAWKPELFGR
jgi:hypothetical protein